jgi:hypothetical protein
MPFYAVLRGQRYCISKVAGSNLQVTIKFFFGKGIFLLNQNLEIIN